MCDPKESKIRLQKIFKYYGKETDKINVGEKKVFRHPVEKEKYFYLLDNRKENKIPHPKHDENFIIEEEDFVKWYIEEFEGDLYAQVIHHFFQLFNQLRCRNSENVTTQNEQIPLQQQTQQDYFGKSV